LKLDWISEDMGRFWRHVTSDSQLRWIGPDKGAIHLATGAVVNAAWDLWAKAEGKPVWRLVADLSPEQLVRCIDFRYITDCITPQEALTPAARARQRQGRTHGAARSPRLPLLHHIRRLAGLRRRQAAPPVSGSGRRRFSYVKLKVGRDLEDDIRRVRIAREVFGPDRKLMIDANQVWEVDDRH
jgi:L-fuconate dehydratase